MQSGTQEVVRSPGAGHQIFSCRAIPLTGIPMTGGALLSEDFFALRNDGFCQCNGILDIASRIRGCPVIGLFFSKGNGDGQCETHYANK